MAHQVRQAGLAEIVPPEVRGGLGAQVSRVYPVSAGNVLNIYMLGAGTGTLVL